VDAAEVFVDTKNEILAYYDEWRRAGKPSNAGQTRVEGWHQDVAWRLVASTGECSEAIVNLPASDYGDMLRWIGQGLEAARCLDEMIPGHGITARVQQSLDLLRSTRKKYYG